MVDLKEIEQSETPIKTGWANPPTLAELKQNYEDAAIEHSSQKTKIDTWLNNLHITGKAAIPEVKHRSNVQPKLIRKQAEWRYPALTEPFLSTSDLFNVSPVTFEDKARALQNELVLNNQFNTKINKVKFIDDYVHTAVNEGTVIVRVGWLTEEAVVEEEVPEYTFQLDPSGQAAQPYAALIELKNTNPSQYQDYVNPGIEQAIEIMMSTGQVVIPIQTGSRIEKRTIEIKNQPTLSVCDYKNIIIDPSCNGDAEAARFVIFNFETSKSELRKAGIYHNIDAIRVNEASPLNVPDHEVGKDAGSFNFKDDARIRFVASEYWGFWDINGTGIVEPFVATWVNNTLIRLEASPFPDKEVPFVFVPLMPVKRSVYGEPDGELLVDNQKIIGAVTRGIIDLMGKSAAGQTGIRKDFLDITNSRRFKSGADYEFNGNVDPRVGVFQHTYPEIPQSAYNMLTMQNTDAESFSGVKAFSAGINSQALGDVATGIRGALDAASKRELAILRRLAAGIIKIGRKILSLNSQFLSEEEVVRVTNEEFVTVKRDDLAGNFDLRLTISTAEEDNQKAQELAFMLQTVGPKVDPKITFELMAEIARLRKMPDVAKKLEEYEPQPDPLAIRKAELEIALLEAQVEREKAMAASLISKAELGSVEVIGEQADALLTMSKAATEKAKARNLTSDADNKDLDYIEQESGVKQERDLEKMRAQAEAQAKTKVLEAMLKSQESKASDKKKVNNLEARADGGPVHKGKPYLVGEVGPELMVSANGSVQVIGKQGPEIIKPRQDATVIPNTDFDEVDINDINLAENQLNSNLTEMSKQQELINRIENDWASDDGGDAFVPRSVDAAEDTVVNALTAAAALLPTKKTITPGS